MLLLVQVETPVVDNLSAVDIIEISDIIAKYRGLRLAARSAKKNWLARAGAGARAARHIG